MDSPSSTPRGGPPPRLLSQKAPPSSNGLSSIMRPIRTHVRIMGYPSAFAHDSSTKRLTVRNLSKSKVPNSATFAEGAEQQDQQQQEVPTADNSAAVYRVHEYGQSIEKFFDEVVAPGIEASLSGQSVTYLLVGPPNSGKSQTMYGDNKSIKGLVGLAGERFLHAMNVNPKVLVTYGNFMTIGDHIQDLAKTYQYSSEVPIKDFPAPLGKMALPGISVLQDVKSCVQMSRDRNAQSSTFAQFHVYKDISPATGSESDVPASTQQQPKKGTFATVTFVDLAAFCDARASAYESKFISNKDAFEEYQKENEDDVYSTSEEMSTLPRDLIHLHRVVDSLISGNDGDFPRTVLTTLAQQFLVGPSTLVAIGTLTGVDTLHSKTMATLRFLEKLSKINQLQALISTIQPPWLEKSVSDINHRLSQREELLSVAKEKAMSDGYFAIRSALTKVMGGYNRFDEVLETTANVRLAVATEQENLDAELHGLIEQKKNRLYSMENNWKSTQSTNSHETDELKKITAQTDAISAKTDNFSTETIAYITACKDKLTALEAFDDKYVRLQRNCGNLRESIDSAVGRLEEVNGECSLVMRGIEYIPGYQATFSQKLEAEVDLQEASARAAGEEQPMISSSSSRSNRHARKGCDEVDAAVAEFVEMAAEIEELCGTSCVSVLSSKGIRITPEMEKALNAAGIQTKATPKPATFSTTGSGSVSSPKGVMGGSFHRRPSTSTPSPTTTTGRSGRYADPTISSAPQQQGTPNRQQGSLFRTSTSFSPASKVRSVASSIARGVSNLKGSFFSGGRSSSVSPVPATPPKSRFSTSAQPTARSRAQTAATPSPRIPLRSSTAKNHDPRHAEEDGEDERRSMDLTATSSPPRKQQHLPSRFYETAEEDDSSIIVMSGISTTRSSHLPLGGLVMGKKRGRSYSSSSLGDDVGSCNSIATSDESEDLGEYDEDSVLIRTASLRAKRYQQKSSARSSKTSARKSNVPTHGSKRTSATKAVSNSNSTTRSNTPVSGGRRAKAPSRGKSHSTPSASKPRRK